MAIPLPELVHQLKVNHLTLVLVGCNEIEVRGPVQSLTPQLKESLREHKPDLLALLGGESYSAGERLAIAHEHELPPQDFDPALLEQPLVRSAIAEGFTPVAFAGPEESEAELLARQGLQAVAAVTPVRGVVNAKDLTQDWQHDQRYEYIGRANKKLDLPASLFANPYPIGKNATRKQVIERYRQRVSDLALLQAQAKVQLSGKILVCWCKPEACHGDVLAEFLLQAYDEQKRNAPAIATPRRL